MMKKILFLSVLMAISSYCFSQTKINKLCKFNGGAVEVTEHVTNGEASAVVLSLRDKQYKQLKEYLYITFDNREEAIEFFEGYLELYNQDFDYIEYEGYNIHTTKILGQRILVLFSGKKFNDNLTKGVVTKIIEKLKQ